MALLDRIPQPAHQRQLDQLIDVEETGSQAVVDVVIVVSDVV